MGSTENQYHLFNIETQELLQTWDQYSSAQTGGVAHADIWNTANTAWKALADIGSGQPIETAKDVSFEDWSPYFNPEGDITDLDAFKGFVEGIDKSYEDMELTDFHTLMETLPGDLLPAEEQIAKAKGDIFEKTQTTLQSKEKGRAEFETKLATSSIYGEQSQVKKKEEETLDPFYTSLYETQGSSGGNYGLNVESTNRLLDWIKSKGEVIE